MIVVMVRVKPMQYVLNYRHEAAMSLQTWRLPFARSVGAWLVKNAVQSYCSGSRIEVYLRYLIQKLYLEHGTRICVIVEAT